MAVVSARTEQPSRAGNLQGLSHPPESTSRQGRVPAERLRSDVFEPGRKRKLPLLDAPHSRPPALSSTLPHGHESTVVLDHGQGRFGRSAP
jgi:hypothetical protein